MKLLQTFANQTQIFEGAYVPHEDLEHTISGLSSQATIWGGLLLITLLVIASVLNERIPKVKLPLFIASAVTIVGVSLYLVGSTIYLNLNADSGGPVHWHADTEIWACGQELELRDPIGSFTNKVGSATLHEHNDKRIHLEGVVVEQPDASLGKFFYVVGGVLTDKAMRVPLNAPDAGPYFDDEEGDYEVDESTRQAIIDTYIAPNPGQDYATFIDGQACPDGTTADVQVFAWRLARDADGKYIEKDGKKVYYQEKIDDPANYTINGESTVPDGDCLIFEFGPTRALTDKKCLQFEVHGDQLGKYIYDQSYGPDINQQIPINDNSQPGTQQACFYEEGQEIQECNDTPNSQPLYPDGSISGKLKAKCGSEETLEVEHHSQECKEYWNSQHPPASTNEGESSA